MQRDIYSLVEDIQTAAVKFACFCSWTPDKELPSGAVGSTEAGWEVNSWRAGRKQGARGQKRHWSLRYLNLRKSLIFECICQSLSWSGLCMSDKAQVKSAIWAFLPLNNSVLSDTDMPLSVTFTLWYFVSFVSLHAVLALREANWFTFTWVSVCVSVPRLWSPGRNVTAAAHSWR